jgi:hypothetical protein
VSRPLEDALRFVAADTCDVATELSSSAASVVSQLELLAAAHAAARRRGEETSLSGALGEAARAESFANAAQALALERIGTELRSALDAQGVSLAFLKGAELLRTGVIANPGCRYSVDLDVLTRRDDFAVVDGTLRSMGFETRGVGGAPKHRPTYCSATAIVEVHEHALWRSDGSPCGLADHALDPVGFTWAHLVHHLFFGSIPSPALVAKTILDVVHLTRAAERAPQTEAYARTLCEGVGLAREHEALAALARALRTGAPIPEAAAAVLALCDAASERALEDRKTDYYVRSLLRAPGWYRRDAFRAFVLTRSPWSAAERIAERLVLSWWSTARSRTRV